MFKAMSGMASVADEDYSKVGAEDTVCTLARLSFNEGYAYMNTTEEFHYFLVMPEPKNGYSVALASVDEYTKLFALLADKKRLRLLTFVCSCRDSLFSLSSASAAMQLPPAQTQLMLDEFTQLEWVLPESADMGNGSVTLYRPADNMALLPLLCFAREFMANAKLFYLNNYLRTKPILDKALE